MTVTNNERREVARRLRELEKGVIGAFIPTGELAEDVLRAIDYGRSGAMTPYGCLADLIEPEPERTCRNVSDNDTGFTCSECGASVTGGNYRHSYVDEAGVRWYTTANAPRWSYCPNCGAKVVDECAMN